MKFADVPVVLRINAKRHDRGERLELEGRLTTSFVPELRRVVSEALERSPQVTLDLSELTFLDADGVRLLRELAARNVPLQGCSAFVEHLLGLRQAGSDLC